MPKYGHRYRCSSKLQSDKHPHNFVSQICPTSGTVLIQTLCEYTIKINSLSQHIYISNRSTTKKVSLFFHSRSFESITRNDFYHLIAQIIFVTSIFVKKLLLK